MAHHMVSLGTGWERGGWEVEVANSDTTNLSSILSLHKKSQPGKGRKGMEGCYESSWRGVGRSEGFGTKRSKTVEPGTCGEEIG